ncbi:MAG: ATP-binding protein [Chitinophagia bacterium]
MRNFFILIAVTFFSMECYGQDSVIHLSSKDLSGLGTFDLGKQHGWYFHGGNDSSWSNPNLPIKGWKKLTFKELNSSYLNQNGELEGWFRIRFMLDSSFRDTSWRFSYEPLSAALIYFDGKPLASFGKIATGSGFNYYQYVDSTHRLNLRPGQVYTMAVHVMDKVVKPGNVIGSDISSEMLWLKNGFIKLYTDNQYYSILDLRAVLSVYYSLWIGINGLIALLFFLLYLLNPKQQTLLFCAGACFFESLNILFSILFNFGGYFGFYPSTLLQIISGIDITFFLLTLFTILTVVKILEIKLVSFNKWLLYFLIFLSALLLFQDLFNVYAKEEAKWVIIKSYIVVPIQLIACVYWVLISFRKSNLSQRAVAIGVLFLQFLIIGLLVLPKNTSIFQLHNLVTALVLCFPFSLLVYVSLRFREINNDILINAQQIVNLSNEKINMASIQQRELEEQVHKRTLELNNSLDDLKSTQKQLIQSEKMASLGELTAGIAHEIQNPLNFVNNFSEVSSELMEDMKSEIKKGNYDEVNMIANDVKQNLEKINHHGQRAADIVKGMLQHSRSSTGAKELTDINALADEYLRLAYHGLRAKDKTFNATMKTDFDAKLSADEAGNGKINIIPQDMGRVILNLITNAFYVVNEKSKQGILDYEPTVSVITKRYNDHIEIKVSDNGNGIPTTILAKIFQPFFTTKPTGKGTGLGLSLSYDIVKAHEGELKVETREGEGTSFIVTLPV